MQYAFVGSGSRGNALLVSGPSGTILIDCGFSLRETTRRLAELGLAPGDLEAVLLTHEHGDHASGVPALARRHELPVYATHGTRKAVADENGIPWRPLTPERCISLAGIEVLPVAVPHDAREPVQFVLQTDGVRLGMLTDLGHITPHVLECYAGCHALVLEANHDRDLLAEGPYPASLKRRVGGRFGHLSNCQARDFLERADTAGLSSLVAAHLSEQNNTLSLARQNLAAALDCAMDRIPVAAQEQVSDWHTVQV